MATVSLSQVLEMCLQNNIVFASYRQPGGDVVTIIQTTQEVQPLAKDVEISQQKGFVIVPFVTDKKCPSRIISPDIVVSGETVSRDLFEKIKSLVYDGVKEPCGSIFQEIEEQDYYTQVQDIVKSIENADFEKAVLSRAKIVNGNHRHKLVATYLKMCAMYPYSMAYIFQADDHLWLGATPEILASVEKGVFRTLSLAATRKNIPENKRLDAWGEKELQEQQYVTDYIEEILKSCDIEELAKSPRYVRQAGNLLHLCRDFTCKEDEVRGKMSALLKALHPTPAVCGMPKDIACDFLLETEKHSRQYYSGYLGPVNIFENHIALYVNLRCMRICKDYACIFVGGGITVDSIAKEEWQETVMKSQTMLAVLEE